MILYLRRILLPLWSQNHLEKLTIMRKILCLSLFLLSALAADAQTIEYPPAERESVVDTYFGTAVSDPYRWLEDDRSARTAAWVEAENAVTDQYMQTLKQRAPLLKRLKEVANYEKVGAPFKRHGRWYFYKNDGLQNQSVLYVTDELGGTPRVMLDPNKLSTDGTVALKGIYFSNDGKYMAYSVSRSGSDWTEFYVMDARTGQLLDDHVEWTKFSGAAWYKDGFYYSTYDRPEAGKEYSHINETHKIYYHRIGTPQSEDVLFYQNPAHPKRFYSVGVNKEETMMFLYESGEGNGNNLYVRDLRKANSQFIQMTLNMDYDNGVAETLGDTIYLFTNDGAPRNRIMRTTIDRPGRQQWQEFVAETDHLLQGAGMYNWQWILQYSVDASSHAYLYSRDGQRQREIRFPSVGSAGFSGDKEQQEVFYTFSSFTVPATIYRYDPATDKSTLYRAPKVNFNANGFETRQLFFTSKDGTRVPMFVTYRKGLKLNGNNPVYLYGYGGFTIGMYPGFSTSRLPFLEQGGIYAVVNLRGGNEYGEEWHRAGTKMQKQNVFDDFIAAAEYLIAEKYTNKEKIAIVGGSNGGLLVGACMTQRPDLFRVAIPQVGVMDMLRYHKFTIGWNWAPDYGTSADSKEMFDYLKGYSPLHNLKEGVEYPATLVTTADHDDRVVPAHSFKFAATLQHCHKGNRPVLIRIDTKAGHGGGKPLSKVLEEQADIYAFIMHNLGMRVKF